MDTRCVMIRKENKKQIKAYLERFGDIYIYGAGAEAVKMYAKLQDMNIFAKAFVVSDIKGNSEKLMGQAVVEATEITDKNNSAFVLGVSERYRDEICTGLKSLGHKNILVIAPPQKWKMIRNYPKLEITAKIGCSIQCRYCPQQLLYQSYFKDDAYRKSLMSIQDYKKCVDNMPKETIISFAGFVEPFLHPQGVDMILYAHETGHPIELYTTFVGLTREQYEQIKDIPFWLVVLHTPDVNQHANIPMTDEYKEILDLALSHRKPNGEPFIDSANCQSEPSEEFMELSRGRIFVESGLVDRAGALSDSNLRSASYKKGKIECGRSDATNHWVLLPDGTVVVCCMDFGLKQVIGNLLENDYEYLIHDEPYVQFRNGLTDERAGSSNICRKCTEAYCVKEERKNE